MFILAEKMKKLVESNAFNFVFKKLKFCGREDVIES